jgi:hypothetical protein
MQSMDLPPLFARIQSVAGRGGAAAIDPTILVALSPQATIDGVYSAARSTGCASATTPSAESAAASG